MPSDVASVVSSPASGHGSPPGAPAGRQLVAIVDDDSLFRESLSINLVEAGFLVVEFPDGADAVDYFSKGGTCDVILLDWRMPKMDGPKVLRWLRASNFDIPVIFLTVLDDEIYEAAALDGGAVDFIEKSRSFSIVLKRISLIGGRHAASGEEPPDVEQHVGKLELRHDCKRASWDGKQVNLTVTKFDIVSLLINKGGSDASYREIYDLVHGEGFIAGIDGEGHRVNVRTFIKRIRRKFRAVDENFGHIENYPAFGYRWRPE